MATQTVRLDGVLWYIANVSKKITPLCPKHHLRLKPDNDFWNASFDLICDECEEPYSIKRSFDRELQYVKDKIDSKFFKDLKVINLDDEAIPLAKSKTENGKYFVTVLLTQSKVGLRLIVYAGEKGKPNKTQIFVEPELKRISFDQKDLHPTDVFIKLEGTFDDGTKVIMEGP